MQMDFTSTKIIEKLKKDGVNIEFIDGMHVRKSSEMVSQNIKDIRVSPLTDDSVIYVVGTNFSLPNDDKNRTIRVDTPTNVIELICEKILTEKWNIFTESDEEKRTGYSFSSRGELYEDKVNMYTLNVAYHMTPFIHWTITLEKGYKQVSVSNGVKKAIKNSYRKLSSVDINLSTSNISLLAVKLRNAIQDMRGYAFPLYYNDRLEVEKLFKSSK